MIGAESPIFVSTVYFSAVKWTTFYIYIKLTSEREIEVCSCQAKQPPVLVRGGVQRLAARAPVQQVREHCLDKIKLNV